MDGDISSSWPNKKSRFLLTAAILELVENNSTDNNATLDDPLPEGRNFHQVKGIVHTRIISAPAIAPATVRFTRHGSSTITAAAMASSS